MSEKYDPQKIESKWPSFAKATEGKLRYNPKAIESKWQKIWEETGAHKAVELKDRPKFYCLDFFPYPSGEGLHVGHWRGYVLSDIISRYQKLNGKNILHPMGYDAFGLPAENAAIKENIHPKIYTQKAIERFRKQLKQIGAMYDWQREINSSDPSYYRWTQWLFLKLYQAGLAYRKKAPVNFCPSCKTVLANEQVIAGECERCETKVIKKDLTQWFFKITQYGQRLLDNLEKLDWPERTKTLQRNWIGRSEGALIDFPIVDSKEKISVFTTRIDTIFGATFIVLSPENDLVLKITNPKQLLAVKKYLKKIQSISDIDRENAHRSKTGVFTGSFAINPINGQKIPIWIADYCLLSYGTGAVMAVPAHDERDFEFGQKFDLPIYQVISPDGRQSDKFLPFIDDGVLINSNQYNKLSSRVARKKISQDLQKKNLAKKEVNFRLRDWLISRQRYWGAPIPIVYCQKCGQVPVPFRDLPVILPHEVGFQPTGESPLKKSRQFLNTTCPRCQDPAISETDTMDTFVDSSWYYLRYTDANNQKELAQKDKINFWLPIDLYVGGIEHATMHLLYARFISLALNDLKIVNFSDLGEPFQKLFNIGLIHLHGAKMSKSKGNVVTPDDLVKEYGSDALRGYEMFVGPAEQDSQWQTKGIIGVYRFLEKVWAFFQKSNFVNENNNLAEIEKTVKEVTEDIELFRLNTAISHLMKLINFLKGKKISLNSAKKINIILAPFFPHLAEEINARLKGKDSIFESSWPKIQKLVPSAEIPIAVQIDGKTRKILTISKNLSQKDIEMQALIDNRLKNIIGQRKINKVIFVPGKVINFVINKEN